MPEQDSTGYTKSSTGPQSWDEVPPVVLRLDTGQPVDERRSRCPDGGTCHGRSLAASSAPCPLGACLRVQTSGPLPGVFPGDRWPPEVIAANSWADGTALSRAITKSSELSRILQSAMSISPGEEGKAADALDQASELADQIVRLAEQAKTALAQFMAMTTS